MTQGAQSRRDPVRRCGRPLIQLWFLALLAIGPRGFGLEPEATWRSVKGWSVVEGLPDSCIKCVLRARDGRLWVGTRLGLVRFGEGRMDVFTEANAPALGAAEISRIAEDASGGIWMTASSGLVHWQAPERFEVFGEDVLPSRIVNVILPDTRTGTWVGTSRGLARRRAEGWERVTDFGAVANLDVNSLAEDQDGRLWVGLHEGLVRHDPATGGTEAIPTPADIPVPHCQAILVEPSRRVWVLLSVRGRESHLLYHLDEGRWTRVENGWVTVGGRTLLPASTQPGRFWDVGADWGLERWIDPSSGELMAPGNLPREAVWSLWDDGRGNLWVGTRSAGVQACRSSGAGSPLPFGSLQAPGSAWRRVEMGLAVVATGAAAGLVGVWWWRRARRIQDHAARVERERLARDLHDSLGAGLTRIAHLAESAGQVSGAPSASSSVSAEMAASADELSRSLREALWMANPADATLEGMVVSLVEHAQSFLNAAQVRCRLEMPDEFPATPIDGNCRREVFLAVKEALHNVVRHAAAREVWLRVRLERTRLTIEVEDDGVGIAHSAPHPRSTGLGLGSMRRRIESLGGTCEIGPRPAGGTWVEFNLDLRGSEAG